MKIFLALGAALTLLPTPSLAHEYQFAGLRIEHPWTRATAPAAQVGVGYMHITNTGDADALVAASTPAAARVEIHASNSQDGMMKMRQQGRAELPAGQVVRFEPGGLHLMLVGLKQPLLAGQKVPLVLRFARAGERKVELKVEAVDADVRVGAERPATQTPAAGHSH